MHQQYTFGHIFYFQNYMVEPPAVPDPPMANSSLW